MPEIKVDAITYPDPLAQFVFMSKTVGGKVVELKPTDDLNRVAECSALLKMHAFGYLRQ